MLRPFILGVVAFGLLAGAVVSTGPISRATPMPTQRQNGFQLPADALDGGRDWINTRGALHLAELKGKIILLDFWTYCCINCHHILPTLARLEAKYPNQLVVIGVHSGKFDAEKVTDNIRQKVNEYGIKHPVVNDADLTIWNKFGVRSWPTLAIIDPTGRLVTNPSQDGGEIPFEVLDRFVGRLVAEHRQHGTLDETPLQFEPEDEKAHSSPLRFPGKVTADLTSKRLFISDTAHNRIVVTDLDGKLIDTIGDGQPGLKNGTFSEARFNRPQGARLVGDVLYVADTENHAIRAVDLGAQSVTTVAGTGVQAPFRSRGGPAATSPISSPWDVLADPENPDVLYIAMAGTHQIWKLDLARKTTSVWAGSGLENVIDGTRGAAAFAQPSGLATDGTRLFVADSEVSGVRSLPFKNDRVETIVGVDLFGFGDKDGQGKDVRLQHCLGVAYGDDVLFIADSYNNKIKVADPKTRGVKTFLGSVQGGYTDDPALFDEPGGVSVAGTTLYVADTNNHAIRAVDLATRKVRTLALEGVTAPKPPRRPPTFPNATVVKLGPVEVKPGSGVTLDVALTLPRGYKLNPGAPMEYLVEAPDDPSALGSAISPLGTRVKDPRTEFQIEVPLAQPAAEGARLNLKLSLKSLICQTTLCEVHSTIWEVPVTFTSSGDSVVKLTNER